MTDAGPAPERRFRLLPVRFRERLLLAMVGLVGGALVLTAFAVLETVREDSLARATDQLAVARRVVSTLLDARSRDLLESTRVLAADFGFKAAVATRDTETIATTLDNHGARIGADVVVLLDNDGAVLAATRGFDAGGASSLLPALQRRAQREGEATGVAVVGDLLLQLVVVPVRAPLPIAWAVMGFRIDEALARDYASLTGLEIAFVGRDAAGDAVGIATRTDAAVEALLATEAVFRGSDSVAAERNWLTTRLELPVAPPMEIAVLLQMPSAQVSRASQSLERQFVVVLVVTLAVALLAGLALARGITHPLQRVIAAAVAIRAGDYAQRLETRAGGEIGLLAAAFNAMQAGIAEREARIRRQALEDGLTGLPNRRFVEHALERRLVARRPFALVIVNLDGFRSINDTFGHDVGDRVLVETAQRLGASARADTEIARIGGDEFVVIIEGAEREAALKRATELRPLLNRTIDIDGSPVAVRATLGVVCSPENGADAGRLLRRAAIAIDRARREREGVLSYPVGADEAHLRELQLIRDLVDTLRRGALTMVYQPKVDVRDGRVRQVEALVRWEHPELGFVPPDEFVFLAEQSGQVQALTRTVLRQVLSDLAGWREAGLDIVPCVNLSAHDLADARFPETLRLMLDDHGLHPRDLGLEITESAVLEDEGRAVASLESLRALGMEIAIDDYGTGYSSLAQIRSLPVTHLKVDKSFVLELEQSADDRKIVKSTIALGHALGLSVVAEGLETLGAWRLLQEWSCDQLQGYHVARPLAAPALLEWLADWDPDQAMASVREVA